MLPGVWAHYVQAQGWLERGDLEQGLRAAAAVGDDTLQHKHRGEVIQESSTHGSAKQRQKCFRRGFDGAQMAACTTLEIPVPSGT